MNEHLLTYLIYTHEEFYGISKDTCFMEAGTLVHGVPTQIGQISVTYGWCKPLSNSTTKSKDKEEGNKPKGYSGLCGHFVFCVGPKELLLVSPP